MFHGSPKVSLAALLLVGTSFAVGTAATGGTLGPVPGTAAQVKSAVTASHKIKQLPALAATQLATFGANHGDNPARIGQPGTNCLLVTSCVYGNSLSKKIVVLFGDSHMWMWMPAIVPAAQKANFRLILLEKFGCPASTLPTSFVYYDSTSSPDSGCGAFHTYAYSAVATLKPTLVVITERTAGIYSGTYPYTNQPAFSTKQWTAALTSTITSFQSHATKVVVLEDVPFLTQDPISCLSVHSSDVQKCSIPYPNPTFPGQQVAQKTAATATGAGFIKSVQWLCTTSCSAVVGKYITYFDVGHVSTTYALYLATVMAVGLKPYLK